jgi:hypothetical protein
MDNPTPLQYCKDPDARAQDVSEQMANWWGYLYHHDDDAAARLQLKFKHDWDIASAPDANKKPQELANEKLCLRFARTHSPADRAEIKSRGLLTAGEWKLVDAGKAEIGMSETALWCSFGAADNVNRTVSASTERKQYVYGSSYVYVVNRRVTAFQDSRSN